MPANVRRAFAAAPDLRSDAIWVLTLFLALRIFLPSRLGVSGLGGAGGPAGIFALGCLGWWTFTIAQRGVSDSQLRWNAVRVLTFVFVCAMFASYAVGMSRPLDPSEMSVADLAALQVLTLVGPLLLAIDGATEPQRLILLLRRLVFMVGLIGVLGVMQFVTREAFIDRITIPGLTASGAVPSLGDRGGFTRAFGTALHPIEYGAVLTLALPMALAVGFSENGKSALRRWWPSLAISAAIVLSISRSALLGAAVGLLVFLPALPRRQRWFLSGGAVLGSVVVFLTIPGLSGTILGMFTGASDDSSVQSRTGSYPLAWEFIRQSPFFGRGIGTFLPQYRILDNQYLLLLIEAGFVGVLSLLALLIAAIRVGLRVSKARHVDEPTRLLARGAGAGMAAAAVELAFFDGFSFPIFLALIFFVTGVLGSLDVLTADRPAPADGVGPVSASV